MAGKHARPVLLVLASTYPRWEHDHEPGFVHELSRRLTDRFRVLALVPHAPGALDSETLDGVEVIRYRYAPEAWQTLVNDGGIVTNLRRGKWKVLLVPTFVLVQAWRAWRLLRTENIDVIHAHWLLPQGLVAALLRVVASPEVPFVVTSHGSDLYALRGKMLDWLKRFVVRSASATTVVSGAMRERLQMIGADMTNVSVQPMGVDMTERFAPETGRSRSHAEILFVGRLVDVKGLSYLLDAMPHVLQRVPDAVLIIAGFGPEEARLRAQVGALGLDASVRFLGGVQQADLPALYRNATLFVAPFIRTASGAEEGLGLVLVEAIGCGCPVVVGDVRATEDLMGDAFRDLRVNPRDAARLASKILEVLSNPTGAREQVQMLRQDIRTRFDWSVVSNRYVDLLLSASRPARQ